MHLKFLIMLASLTESLVLQMRSVVEKFQESVELHPDGIVGKGTLKEINEALDKSGNSNLKFELGDYPDPEELSSKMSWTKVEADQLMAARVTRTSDCEDVVKAYNALRYEVLSLGGVTSAGAKRPLSDSKKMKSRSIKSLHYTGLAFDMALDSGITIKEGKVCYRGTG